MHKQGMYHRRSIRLKNYDYGQPGAYFVTICTRDRACVLGNVVDGAMVLSRAGALVHAAWLRLVERFSRLSQDVFVVIPNHLHGIIACEGAELHQGAMNRAPTVGEIVRAFKAAAARRIRQCGMGTFAWQRNYYEHVVRDERTLSSIREYIVNNSQQWALDRENPDCAAKIATECKEEKWRV